MDKLEVLIINYIIHADCLIRSNQNISIILVDGEA